MDVRHPLTSHDEGMLELALGRQLPVHILLTKADKLGRGAGMKVLAGVRRDVAKISGAVGHRTIVLGALGGRGRGRARRDRAAARRQGRGGAPKRNPGWTSGSNRGKLTRYWGMTGRTRAQGGRPASSVKDALEI